MSLVKLKNAVLKTLNSAIATGHLPAGLIVAASLSNRRIWIDINAAPIDTIRPERIKNTALGTSVTIDLFADDLVNYTPEGLALKAKVAEIAQTICPVVVHFSSECFTAQGRRANAARQAAAVAAS
jgi:hypothetical protein